MISNLHLRHTSWHSSNRNGMRRDTCLGRMREKLSPRSRMSILLQRGNAVILGRNRIPNRPGAYTDGILWSNTNQLSVFHRWSWCEKMKHISTHISKHVLCTQTILTWESLSVVWPGGHVDNVAQFAATSQQNDSSRLFSPPAGVAMLKLLFHHNNCWFRTRSWKINFLVPPLNMHVMHWFLGVGGTVDRSTSPKEG